MPVVDGVEVVTHVVFVYKNEKLLKVKEVFLHGLYEQTGQRFKTEPCSPQLHEKIQ